MIDLEFDEYDDEGEPFDNPHDSELDNCGQFVSDGHVVCSLIGSEDCDFCPCHVELGERVETNFAITQEHIVFSLCAKCGREKEDHTFCADDLLGRVCWECRSWA